MTNAWGESRSLACMDMTEPSIWYLSEAKVQAALKELK